MRGKERQILYIFFNMQNLVIKKLLEELERWLSCYEYLLLLQRTWVPFPAPAQRLTPLITPVPRDLKITFDFLGHQDLGEEDQWGEGKKGRAMQGRI